MKISEIIKEGDVLPFGQRSAGRSNIPLNKPIHQPSSNVPKHNPVQDKIDDLIYNYRNLSVGSQIRYNNRLAQIIKVPDDHRFIIKFDDNGEKKIIGNRDEALGLIPEEQL